MSQINYTTTFQFADVTSWRNALTGIFQKCQESSNPNRFSVVPRSEVRSDHRNLTITAILNEKPNDFHKNTDGVTVIVCDGKEVHRVKPELVKVAKAAA